MFASTIEWLNVVVESMIQPIQKQLLVNGTKLLPGVSIPRELMEGLDLVLVNLYHNLRVDCCYDSLICVRQAAPLNYTVVTYAPSLEVPT